MTIKAALPIGPVELLASDTTIINISSIPAYTRYRVEAFNIHNTTGAPITVTFYYSPDTTSASGSEIAVITLGALENDDVNAIIGQGREDNIIAVATAVGVNATMTYVGFGGDD